MPIQPFIPRPQFVLNVKQSAARVDSNSEPGVIPPPPTPSVTPTISLTPSVTPTHTPTSSMTPTPTPTMTQTPTSTTP